MTGNMHSRGIPLKTLLLRTFLPAVIIVAIALAALVYNRLYASTLDGFERKLVTTAAVTGAMIDPADHDLLIAAARAGGDLRAVEASNLYQRNVRPIARIRSELGLTYLYTQVLGGSSDILYVLDGTSGGDHSPLGSPDSLPVETVTGLKELRTNGTIYVSPVEYQQQWGLLKTAAAPVLGRNGRIAASAGADVNISVIRIATQNALFTSAMVGVGSILLCVLVSIALVRRIAGPIEALTDTMLTIAGGNEAAFSARARPREIKRLATTLATLVGKASAEARCRDENLAAREETMRAALLANRSPITPASPLVLVERADTIVLWIADQVFTPKAVLAHYAMTQHALSFAEHCDLAADWQALVDLDSGICLVINGRMNTIELVGSHCVDVGLGDHRSMLEPGIARSFDRRETIALFVSDEQPLICWPQVRP